VSSLLPPCPHSFKSINLPSLQIHIEKEGKTNGP